MNKLEIIGWGSSLPSQRVQTGGQTRYRAAEGETQLGMMCAAARKALAKAGIATADLDCIVAAAAVGVQPIPCTAALVHEQIAQGSDIPAFDINSTCTGFITALDTVSYLIAAKRYRTVLIVAGDLASCEIRGGLTALPPQRYAQSDPTDFLFDMKGRDVLKLSLQKIPALFAEFWTQTRLSPADIDLVIPHQASKALPLMMKTLGFKTGQYIDTVAQYGNMVSASVPFALCQALDEGRLKTGNKILLTGTAAGLTCNILCLQI